jgi:hypothetical protein
MPLIGKHRTEFDTQVEVKKPDKSPAELLNERIKLTFNTLKACERAKERAIETYEKAAIDIAYYGQSVDRERKLLNELGRQLLQAMTKPEPSQISQEMEELRKKFPNE